MKMQAEMLKSFMRRLFLEQMVHVNTRQNNILDLVLTNNQEYIQEISVRDTALSDHRLLEIGVQPFQTIANQNRPNAFGNDLSRLNFRHKSVNWDQISAEYAEVPWYSVLQDLSVEEMYSSLCQKITEVCQKHIPLRKSNKRSRIPQDRKIIFRKLKEIKKKLKF